MCVGNFIFFLSQGMRGSRAALFIAVLSAGCMSGHEGDSLRFVSLIGIPKKKKKIHWEMSYLQLSVDLALFHGDKYSFLVT